MTSRSDHDTIQALLDENKRLNEENRLLRHRNSQLEQQADSHYARVSRILDDMEACYTPPKARRLRRVK